MPSKRKKLFKGRAPLTPPKEEDGKHTIQNFETVLKPFTKSKRFLFGTNQSDFDAMIQIQAEQRFIVRMVELTGD